MNEEEQSAPNPTEPSPDTGDIQASSPVQEREIDLNTMFPEADLDLNALFPDMETKRLLKTIRRNKKDLHFMKERFAQDSGNDEEEETDSEEESENP